MLIEILYFYLFTIYVYFLNIFLLKDTDQLVFNKRNLILPVAYNLDLKNIFTSVLLNSVKKYSIYFIIIIIGLKRSNFFQKIFVFY